MYHNTLVAQLKIIMVAVSGCFLASTDRPTTIQRESANGQWFGASVQNYLYNNHWDLPAHHRLTPESPLLALVDHSQSGEQNLGADFQI